MGTVFLTCEESGASDLTGKHYYAEMRGFVPIHADALKE
jgi:NAD(P)H-dependent flavin oxidoreductase YrpB (nitropropane dioxygenase family)